jgi:hypothetical protein
MIGNGKQTPETRGFKRSGAFSTPSLERATMSRIDGLRLVAGFVLAPGIGILVIMLALSVNYALTPGADESSYLSGAALFGMFGICIAYSATFIVGLPLFILFRIRGWLRVWQISAGGLLVGALFAVLPGTHFVFALMFCAVGLTTGLAFWLIAIFRNCALTPGSRDDAPKAARV